MVKIDATANSTSLRHIAFIMDGNGRWAEKRGMPREYGHKYGAKALKKVIERCAFHGIEAATFYAFSTENWKRPQKEVDALMNLLDDYLDQILKDVDKNDVKYKFIGDVSVLKDTLRNKINILEEKSREKKYIVNIALNYGSKSELLMVYNKLMGEGKKAICEKDIDDALYTAESPSLDLLVRTGGELRLSNFLLWQSAYAELYFTDVLWPDMNENEVDLAVEAFHKRKRRFGAV